MKYNRELKGWEKLLMKVRLPYLRIKTEKDAFGDYTIYICKGWRWWQPKNYRRLQLTDEETRQLHDATVEFYSEFRNRKRTLLASSRYGIDSIGAYTRRGPIANRDLGDEA